MTHQIPVKPPHPAVELVKSILLGLTVLAAGIAIGASAMFLHLSKKFLQRMEQPPIAAEMMLNRISSELRLTEQQIQQLKPILKQHFQQLEALRTQIRPQIIKQWQEMDKDIQNVLTEPQRQHWQQRVKRFQERLPIFHGQFPDQPRRPFRPMDNGKRPRPGFRPEPPQTPDGQPLTPLPPPQMPPDLEPPPPPPPMTPESMPEP